MIKELKEIKGNEIKETRRMISHQIENFSKDREVLKRNQMEILSLKSLIMALKIFTTEVQQ